MSISDIKTERRGFLLFTGFCILFAAIYEHFSHGVYSLHMILAFLYPLLGGALVCQLFLKAGSSYIPGVACGALYGSAIYTLAFGSLFRGVLQIYGTTNRLVIVYTIAGCIFLFLSVCLFLIGRGRQKNRR